MLSEQTPGYEGADAKFQSATPRIDNQWPQSHHAMEAHAEPEVEIGGRAARRIPNRLPQSHVATKECTGTWNAKMLLQHQAKVELPGFDITDLTTLLVDP